MYRIAPLFLAILLACGSKTDSGKGSRPLREPLSQQQIFNHEEVAQYIYDNELAKGLDTLKQRSRRDFSKGLDLAVNKKQYAAAIAYYQRSLQTYPEAQTYLLLSQALTENRQLDDAQKALELARKLNYEPENALQLTEAKILALKGDKPEAVTQLLRNAVAKGGPKNAKWLADPAFDAVRQSEEFQLMMAEMPENSDNADSLRFDQLVKGFGPVQTSYQLNTAYLDSNTVLKNKTINYVYADFVKEMEHASFGRMVSDEFYYVARLQAPDGIVALLYADQKVFGGPFRTVNFFLATYTTGGKALDKRLVAANTDAERLTTLAFSGNEVTSQDKKRIWDKPYSEEGADGNRITGYQNLNNRCFSIQNDGKILEQKARCLAMAN